MAKRNEPGPSSLMTRTDTPAGITREVLMKEHALQYRFLLELFGFIRIPGIPEVQRWHHSKICRIVALVRYRKPDENVIRSSLRILDLVVEITVPVKGAGVEQLELRFLNAASPIHFA